MLALPTLTYRRSWASTTSVRVEWPPVPIVFWAFRIMVGLGLLMLLLAGWSLLARVRGALYESPWLHRLALAMGPAGFVAVIAGWVTTEVGRQPYTVHGLLRTVDSVSPLEAPAVATSLLAFICVYFIVFGAGRPTALALFAGLAGSFVGGLLISLLSGDGLDLKASGIIGSIVGAVIILLVVKLVRDRATKS